jgi:ribonuclease HII
MLICGIDEAGRGPVIGPMVICGVALDASKINYLRDLKVKDSKQLSPAQRERIFRELTTIGVHHVIVVEPAEIDDAVTGHENLNWLEARKAAEIITKLQPQTAIVDCPSPNLQAFAGFISNLLPFPIDLRCEHKADANHEIVAAASIIAKVTRDRLIEEIKKKHGVEFGSGYMSDPRTSEFIKTNHQAPYVRKSWARVQKLLTGKVQKGLGDF